MNNLNDFWRSGMLMQLTERVSREHLEMFDRTVFDEHADNRQIVFGKHR